jgi:hypothetical protein
MCNNKTIWNLCDNKTIWNELVKSEYQLKLIEITIGAKLLEIHIIFDNHNDLDNFTNDIFNKYYHSMNNIEPSNNSLLLNIFHTTIDTFETLNYPPNVNIIKIYKVNNQTSKLIKSSFYQIKLFNLPEKLTQLKIVSLYTFDLSNLPTQIILLDIAESPCKFNLDYLPDSIQILYFPPIVKTIHNDFYYFYKLSDLSNLPSSLIELNFGNFIIYKSIGELMEKFNKDFK